MKYNFGAPLRWGVQDYLPSLDPFLDICNIDFVVNENPSQAKFTCPKLVNPLESCPKDTDSGSDSEWEEEDTHDDGRRRHSFFISRK